MTPASLAACRRALARHRQPRLRDRLAADEIRVVPNRARLADEKALHFVAFLAGEDRELLGRFDAFGGHRKAELARERDRRTNDRPGIEIALEVRDEGSIDLDLGERE